MLISMEKNPPTSFALNHLILKIVICEDEAFEILPSKVT